MSAFLGPIHHWLFHKIKLQQEIVEQIIRSGKPVASNLQEELDAEYGTFPEGALETIIDGGNIHGWLQHYVSQVEYKLAVSATTLLRKNLEMSDKIKTIFYEKGKEISGSITTDHAAEIYKIVSDSLLDGMPCDHANTVLEESSDKVIWQRNTCVHKAYWEEIQGEPANYYLFRDEFIKGILINTNFRYEKVNEVTSMITRSGNNKNNKVE